MGDKYLKSQANERTITISEEHPDWSEEDVIVEAMRQTSEWRGVTQPTALEQQEEKKKTIQRLPSASSRNEVDVGYKPKTKSEIFADIASNRSRK